MCESQRNLGGASAAIRRPSKPASQALGFDGAAALMGVIEGQGTDRNVVGAKTEKPKRKEAAPVKPAIKETKVTEPIAPVAPPVLPAARSTGPTPVFVDVPDVIDAEFEEVPAPESAGASTAIVWALANRIAGGLTDAAEVRFRASVDAIVVPEDIWPKKPEPKDPRVLEMHGRVESFRGPMNESENRLIAAKIRSMDVFERMREEFESARARIDEIIRSALLAQSAATAPAPIPAQSSTANRPQAAVVAPTNPSATVVQAVPKENVISPQLNAIQLALNSAATQYARIPENARKQRKEPRVVYFEWRDRVFLPAICGAVRESFNGQMMRNPDYRKALFSKIENHLRGQEEMMAAFRRFTTSY